MALEDIQSLIGLTPETYILFLLLAIFRPLGLLYGFTLFSWGFGQGLMMRIGVSFAFGILVFWNSADVFISIAETTTIQKTVLILAIEYAIGFGLGTMASIPFHALKYAGAITDTYRGENNSGITDPSGGTLSSFSVLYFIAGAVVFTQAGGFYVMIDNLYTTYTMWPIGTAGIEFNEDAWRLGPQILQRSLLSSIAIAAPLLIIFLAIDFALAVAAKLAPRFNLYDNSFIGKNIAAVLSLPIIAFYLIRISTENMGYAYDAVFGLESFLK
ncbi:MAG: flagellar biosynthetic protein FliR [Pseudoruegeria sp.]